MDLASSVAMCDAFETYRTQMVDAWGPSLAPTIHSWITGPRSQGELRNFARTLVPLSLYEALVPDRASKSTVREALPSRRKALTRIINSVCTYRRNNPLPDPPPPALTRNSFFQSHGP